MKPVEDLTFRDVYPLKAVKAIFEKKTKTDIMGMEPSRLRNKYDWTVYEVHQKLAFWRREIDTTALLLDGIESGTFLKPFTNAAWPGWIKSSCADHTFESLKAGAQKRGPTPRFQRALKQAEILNAQFPPSPPIAAFLRVDEVGRRLGVSREVVYRRSDIRLGAGKGLPTIEYSGTHLWYPLPLWGAKK